MNDSRNAEQIRDILRLQFENAAERARDPATSDHFSKLAETTAGIPAALADAYSEFFEGIQDSEIGEREISNKRVCPCPALAALQSRDKLRMRYGVDHAAIDSVIAASRAAIRRSRRERILVGNDRFLPLSACDWRRDGVAAFPF